MLSEAPQIGVDDPRTIARAEASREFQRDKYGVKAFARDSTEKPS